MSQNTEQWKELISRKEEFQHILRVLNNYYEMVAKTRSASRDFRKKIAKEPSPSGFRVFFKKFGNYEFEVLAFLESDPREEERWFHLDGIQEERDKLKTIGNLEHPVFQIVCVSDLYELDSEGILLTDIPFIDQKKDEVLFKD